MDLKDIVEVCETSSEEEVNRYVKAGWQLLEITKHIGGGDYPSDTFFLYCLGWNVAKGDVVHPEPPFRPPVTDDIDDDVPFQPPFT